MKVFAIGFASVLYFLLRFQLKSLHQLIATYIVEFRMNLGYTCGWRANGNGQCKSEQENVSCLAVLPSLGNRPREHRGQTNLDADFAVRRLSLSRLCPRLIIQRTAYPAWCGFSGQSRFHSLFI